MLEKLKSKLDHGITAASVKSEALMETNRTKSNINAKQKQAETLKAALGIKLYAAWKAGSATVDMFAGELNAIAAVEAEIESLIAHLQEIKDNEAQALSAAAATAAAAAAAASAGNQKFCPTCGKALPTDCRFCDVCGSPLS